MLLRRVFLFVSGCSYNTTMTGWAKSNAQKLFYGQIFILLVGFGLRLVDSAHRSLWFDEAVEFLTASAPFAKLPSAIVASNYQPPLNTYLLHFWLQISIHPLWIRLLFIGLSLLSMAGLMLWARLHWGEIGGVIAGAITAVMPTELYYAQDVGEYALLVCLLTYTLLFLDLAFHKRRWRYWFLAVFFSVGSIFTHYGAAIIILPITIMILLINIQHRDWLSVKRQAMLMAAGGLTGLPLIFYFLPQQIQRVSSNALSRPFTSVQQELSNGLGSFAKTFSYPLIGWPLSSIPLWVRTIIILIFGLPLIIFSLPDWRKSPLIWLFLPYIFYFGLVRLGLYIGFGFRYALIFTPLLIMTLVWIITRLIKSPLPMVGWVVLTGLLVGQLYVVPHPTFSRLLRDKIAWSPQEDLQLAFNYWENGRKVDEPTFVYYGAVPAMRYYLQLSGLDQNPVEDVHALVECSAETRLPVCQENQLYFSTWARSLTPEEKIADMFATMGGEPEKVWLLFSHVHQDEESEMLENLQKQYQIVNQVHAGDPSTASAYLLKRNVP